MSLVWRKLKRANQEAHKYRFVATFQELMIQCDAKWNPDKIVIAWERKRSGRFRRRYLSKPHRWEPSLTDHTKGYIVWPPIAPECMEITTTLYKDKRLETFEDKEWLFIIEEVMPNGKNRPLASVPLNLRLFQCEIPGAETEVKLKVRPLYKHVMGCVLQLVLTSSFVKQGAALDDDVQSLSSLISTHPQTSKDYEDRLSMENFDRSGSPASGSSDTVQKIRDLVQDFGSFPNSGELENECSEEVTDSVKKTHIPSPLVEPKPKIRERKQSGKETESLRSSTVVVPSSLDLGKTGSSVEPGSVSRKSLTNDTKTVGASSFLSSFPAQQKLDKGVDKVSSDAESDIITRVAPPAAAPIETPILHNNAYDDLLIWCQEVTKTYRGVKIENFTKSFRNGLAFAAIIHKFRPELIDFGTLQAQNIRDNCFKAFAAAEAIGVPQLMSPSEMAITAIPDKLTVMTYVHQLRDRLTGRQTSNSTTSGEFESRYSFLGPTSDFDNKVAEEFEKIRKQKEHESVIYMDDKTMMDLTPLGPVKPSHPINEKNGEILLKDSSEWYQDQKKEFSPADVNQKKENSPKKKMKKSRSSSGSSSGSEQPNFSLTLPADGSSNNLPLMTRNQLRNPFDSDEETDGTKKKNGASGAATAAAATKSPENVPKVFEAQGNTEESPVDMKRQRARALLDQFRAEASTSQVQSPSSENSEEDDEHKKQLRLRAKQLIAEAKEQALGGRPIKISESVTEAQKPVKVHSAPNTRLQTPLENEKREILNGLPRPIVEDVRPVRIEHLGSNVAFYQFRRGVPYDSNSPIKQKRSVIDEDDDEFDDKNVGHFDRFKRFGSMKAQELSAITSHLAKTIRSVSLPKELGQFTENFSTPLLPPRKLESEDSTDSMSGVVHELEMIGRRLEELDNRAKQVERSIRETLANDSEDQAAIQATILNEERLTNEYLTLLNERNQLQRREFHLHLMLKIHEQEEKFRALQNELQRLISMDEKEKTEATKQRIDHLMNELIVAVDSRDQLAQQMIANENKQVDDESMAQESMSKVALMAQDDKNCVIQ